MKCITTIIILALLAACGPSPTRTIAQEKKITRKVQQDINTLLPSGEFTVDIMDKVTMSPRRQELQLKFMQGVKSNQEWFLQQQKIVEQTGTAIPYDLRLGMTEPEWNEYIKLTEDISDMQVVSSGVTKVTISKQNGVISFKTDEKLAYLNAITIDAKNNTVQVLGHVLHPLDTICVNKADNVFKSAWRGYKWEFSEPSDLTMPSTQEEMASFSMKLYSVTLGLFERTGKTYLNIKGAEISDGIQISKYEIPLVFQ